ncbi:MAG: VWA domain-containing protein [Candidatus Omnitrophica bacterium]|nr:VWA domain-containing protein [Candidatus Omnitrophota bacterium]
MKLADPAYFFLIIPVIVIVWLFIKGYVGKEGAVRFSSVQIIRQAGARNISLRRLLQVLLRLAVLILLLIAMSRPQTGEGKTEESKDVIDIMLALDISSSMATLDFHPENRLVAAKAEAKKFIQSRPDDRIGIVTFAKHSFTVSPLTTDHRALEALVDGVQIGMVEDGTAIGVGLANAINRLRDSEAKSKVAILLTDGVNNAGKIDPQTAGEIAKTLGIKVYTIGMGKDGESMVPVVDPRYGQRLVRVQTVIDEKLLSRVSGMTGGSYYRAKDETGLSRIFDEINRLEKTEILTHSYTTYHDHYMRFLVWAVALLVFEAAFFQFIWRKVP